MMVSRPHCTSQQDQALFCYLTAGFGNEKMVRYFEFIKKMLISGSKGTTRVAIPFVMLFDPGMKKLQILLASRHPTPIHMVQENSITH